MKRIDIDDIANSNHKDKEGSLAHKFLKWVIESLMEPKYGTIWNFSVIWWVYSKALSKKLEKYQGSEDTSLAPKSGDGVPRILVIGRWRLCLSLGSKYFKVIGFWILFLLARLDLGQRRVVVIILNDSVVKFLQVF